VRETEETPTYPQKLVWARKREKRERESSWYISQSM